LQANAMRLAVNIAVVVGMIWLMFRLSRDVEVLPGRWWRISLSLLPAWVIGGFVSEVLFKNEGVGFGGFTVVLCIVLLGYLWRGVLAHQFSLSFMGMLFGSQFRLTGFQPDFRLARLAVRDGDWEGALQRTEVELKKSPTNYEVLLLLTEIHVQARAFAKAFRALDTILDNPEASNCRSNLKADRLPQETERIGATT
jgi:hypothetical protein